MSKLVDLIVAALFPLLWKELEPLVRDVLSQKLDALIPDQIDKQLPKLIEETLKSGFNLLGLLK
ncbi:hypothetical protein SEA_REINDEER_36 [Mycobacterium phage Reindeer]|uniref:Uncharacterized protein n=1 Tax=Mycobacterium phage Reindeer TaxID=2762283 RepID=A0A7G8LHX4_9CAUD|nr:hypothetical protein J4U05_gp036 [Mycobacterium phage Reindeer]QNJ56846.1 hypothetical protein SEA_REINDEER_36 [Mycobacterium phage Reindeer]